MQPSIIHAEKRLAILASETASDDERKEANEMLREPFVHLRYHMVRNRLANKRRGKQYTAIIEHIDRLHSLTVLLPLRISAADQKAWRTRLADLRTLLSSAGEDS